MGAENALCRFKKFRQLDNRAIMDPSPLSNNPNPHPSFTLQEIENTCLMFSYSSNPTPAIQSKLNEIFRANSIDNK